MIEMDLNYNPSSNIYYGDKVFIPRKQYYQDAWSVDKYADILDQRYLVDIGDVGKEEDFFDRFGKRIQFIKKDNMDENQKRWYKGNSLKVYYLRPQKMAKDGIYVSKYWEETEEDRRIIEQTLKNKGIETERRDESIYSEQHKVRNFSNINY